MQSPTSSELLPRASLNYWIKANEKAITLGKHLLRNRFLVINFDEFVLAPRKGIEELVHSLELDQENINISELSDLPKIPRSIGRYKKHDTGIFSEDEINAVRKLGFVVDGNSS